MTESLRQCLEALELSVSVLENTVSKLDSSSRVSNELTTTLLQSRRVFELVPEYDVQRAKLDLIQEVEPLVNRLNGKLVKGLNKLEREREALLQTYELNKLQLNNKTKDDEEADADMSTDPVVVASSTREELDLLKHLKKKREELSLKYEDLVRSS
ncbi:LAFE_0H05974g1_1 [Lachancea fermentati]|uniref:DASH complex subunit SPC19 n=1 Tax=Lachancea fermentati TaxID=4955 RepID=A0A1G4MJQ4_LACFM|nr:LAFE_0H05974g1_1 [Lachancea fermentati]